MQVSTISELQIVEASIAFARHYGAVPTVERSYAHDGSVIGIRLYTATLDVRLGWFAARRQPPMWGI